MSDFAAQWLFGASAPEGVPFEDAALEELPEAAERPSFLRELDDRRRLVDEAETERRSQPVPRGHVEEVPRSFRLSGRPPRPEPSPARGLRRDPDVEKAVEATQAAVGPALAPVATEAPSAAAEPPPATPATEVAPLPPKPDAEPASVPEAAPETAPAPPREPVSPRVVARAPVPRAALVPLAQPDRPRPELPRVRLSRRPRSPEPTLAPALQPQATAAAEPRTSSRGLVNRVREVLRVSKRGRDRASVSPAAAVELPSPVLLDETRPEPTVVSPEPAVLAAEPLAPTSPPPTGRVPVAPSEDLPFEEPPPPEPSAVRPDIAAAPTATVALAPSRLQSDAAPEKATPATEPLSLPVPIELVDVSPRAVTLIEASDAVDEPPTPLQPPAPGSPQPRLGRGWRPQALRPLLRAARSDRRPENGPAPAAESPRVASSTAERPLPGEQQPTSRRAEAGGRETHGAAARPAVVLRTRDVAPRRAARRTFETASPPTATPAPSVPTSGSRLAELSGGAFSVGSDGVETVSFPWAQPEGTPATAAMVFRAAEAPEPSEAASAPDVPVPAAPAPTAPSPPSAAPQLDELYEHVVERLRRDLLVERERMGDLLGDLP